MSVNMMQIMKVISFIHSSKILVRTFHVFEMILNHGNTPVNQTIKTLVLGELTFSWGEKRLKNNIRQKLDHVSAKRKNITG